MHIGICPFLFLFAHTQEKKNTNKQEEREKKKKMEEEVLTADEGGEEVDKAQNIFNQLRKMTPSEAAQYLDKARRTEVKLVEASPGRRKEREGIWSFVYQGLLARDRNQPFRAKETDLPGLRVLCMTAEKFDEEWSNLSELTRGKDDSDVGDMPHRSLSLCFYYACYVSNVFRFTQGCDAVTVVERVNTYHRVVTETLEALKTKKARPGALEVVKLSGKSKATYHLFHQLFGYPKEPQTSGKRLYLPAQLLFHTWNSINLDGEAFRLYHVMLELEWLNRATPIKAVRVEHLSNTVSLGNVFTMASLQELTIEHCRDFKKTFPLLGKKDAAVVDGIRLPRKLTKLVLVDIPTISRLPSQISVRNLKELHLENVSLTSGSLASFLTAVLTEAGQLQTLILKGPSMTLVPDLVQLPPLPVSLLTLVLDNLPGIISLPRLGGHCASLTLANLTVPLVHYIAIIAKVDPVNLVLEHLKVLVPPHIDQVGGAPSQKDMDARELGLIMGSGQPLPRLKKCAFRNVGTVADFNDVLAGALSLEELFIDGDAKNGKLFIPFKEMPKLQKIVVFKDAEESLSKYLAPESMVFWNRQVVLLSAVPFSASAEEDPSLPMVVVAVADEDAETLEATLDLLQDMLIPFGLPRAETTREIALPPWIDPDLIVPSNSDQEFERKRILASTWLEWETATSSWLADTENDEGLLLIPQMSDLKVVKTVEYDEGEPDLIVFTARSSESGANAKGANDGEKNFFKERGQFLSSLVVQDFPVFLRFLRRERVIGQAPGGQQLTSVGVNLNFSVASRVTRDKQIVEGVIFDSDEFDPVTHSCNVRFVDDLAGVNMRLGTLTLLFARGGGGGRGGDAIPDGFRFTITVASAMRFLAAQTAAILGSDVLTEMDADRTGAVEPPPPPAEKGGQEGSGVDITRKMAQITMASSLSTCLDTVEDVPFVYGERNELVLEAVREEPNRHLLEGPLLLVYAQTIGVRHLLAVSVLAGNENADAAAAAEGGERLLTDKRIRAHLQNTLLTKYLIPVASWCVAWSPSDRALPAQDQIPRIDNTARVFSKILKAMQTSMLSRNEDEYTDVLLQLFPSPEGEDNGQEEEEEDEEENSPGRGGGGGASYTDTYAIFWQLVADVIDNENALSPGARVQITEASSVIERELRELRNILLEAKTSHSGDGQYLDMGEVIAYVTKVLPEARITRKFDACIKAIETIVATFSPPGSPVSSDVASPEKKRSKLDLQARARVPSPVKTKAATFSPSIVLSSPSSPSSSPVMVIIKPKKAAQAVILDVTSPPKKKVKQDGGGNNNNEAIDLASPPRRRKLFQGPVTPPSPSAAAPPKVKIEPDQTKWMSDNEIALEARRRAVQVLDGSPVGSPGSSKGSDSSSGRGEDYEMEIDDLADEIAEDLKDKRRKLFYPDGRRREAKSMSPSSSPATPSWSPATPSSPSSPSSSSAKPKEKTRAIIVSGDDDEDDRDGFEPDSPINALICGHCGDSQPDMHVCSKCKAAFYCGPDCQHSAWAEHKKVCGAASIRRT